MIIMKLEKGSGRVTEYANSVVIGVILVSTYVEALWGILQMTGLVRSGHALYGVTGSFYNPGPYGCFLALGFPVTLWEWLTSQRRWLRLSGALYLILAAMPMAASMSRTGWLAGAMGCAVVLWRHFRVTSDYLKSWRGIAIGAGVIMSVVAGAVFCYHLKEDSVDGRILVWKVACDAVADHPLFGVGWENVAGAYGDAQETYFATDGGTFHEKRIAGAPSFLFNEYLQIALAFGIPAAILFVAMLVTAFVAYAKHGQMGLCGALTAFAVGCFFSYPLQFVEFKVMGLILLTCGMLCVKPRHLRTVLTILTVILCLMFVGSTPKVDVEADFQEAKYLATIRRYEESNLILKWLLLRSSDPMPLNILGKNCQALGQRDSAEYWFLRAVNRVPNRFYPHYLLMKLYAEDNVDSAKMLNEARWILESEVKVASPAISDMQKEARELIVRMSKNTVSK